MELLPTQKWCRKFLRRIFFFKIFGHSTNWWFFLRCKKWSRKTTFSVRSISLQPLPPFWSHRDTFCQWTPPRYMGVRRRPSFPVDSPSIEFSLLAREDREQIAKKSKLLEEYGVLIEEYLKYSFKTTQRSNWSSVLQFIITAFQVSNPLRKYYWLQIFHHVFFFFSSLSVLTSRTPSATSPLGCNA